MSEITIAYPADPTLVVSKGEISTQMSEEESMYAHIDKFIKEHSVRDFVDILFNVLKDQNEAKKKEKENGK